MKAKKRDIVHKLKIARGQIDGILQMVEEDRYCVDISTQLQSTQALLKSANQQIMQAHIRSCVREALQTDVENPKLEEALTLFQSLGKANKATWLVLFRQIILFIPLCVLLPMIGGLGIRGVWLAIALTDAVLVVITIAMMASEFRKMPPTSQTLR